MRCRREYWNHRALDFSMPHGRLRLVGRTIEQVQRRLRRTPLAVLDIGCAGAALRDILPGGVEYFGVDVAPAMIQRQQDAGHFEEFDAEVATSCFGGRRFDVVVCSGVVEYIRHLEHFFAFLREAVKPDGYLLLTYLNHSHYLDLLLHKRYKDPHVNFMSIANFVRFVRRQGFQIEQDTSLTVSAVELPLLAHCRRLPLSILNRNYLFVCRREPNQPLPDSAPTRAPRPARGLRHAVHGGR